MTETAGFGPVPWLPERVARTVAAADAREAAEANRAEEAQAAQNETVQAEALELFRVQAETRGEDVSALAVAKTLELFRLQAEGRGEDASALALAAGAVSGRSVGDVLTDAAAMAKQQDVIDKARASRDGRGEPEPLHIDVGEPNLVAPAARSEHALRLFNAGRHFFDRVAARGTLARAELAAERSRNDYGLVNVTVRPKDDPVVPLTLSSRADAIPGGPVSYR
jgi:hypothetical protein